MRAESYFVYTIALPSSEGLYYIEISRSLYIRLYFGESPELEINMITGFIR
jgi:hypothetical protein